MSIEDFREAFRNGELDQNGEQLEKLLENIGHLAFKVVELERRVEELEEKEDKNMTVGGFPYEPYL